VVVRLLETVEFPRYYSVKKDGHAFIDPVGFEGHVAHLAILNFDHRLAAVEQLLRAQLGVEAKSLVKQVEGAHHRHVARNVHAIHLLDQDRLGDIDVEMVFSYPYVLVGSVSELGGKACDG